MSNRRTAAEAFNMPDVVKSFIDRGVETAYQPVDTLVRAASNQAEPKKSTRKVVELDEERPLSAASTVATNHHKPHRQPDAAVTSDLSRTYAKATVQKTIRFHPKLIAELDGFIRHHELSGEKPISFQQIQNEALELWIEQRVRQSESNSR